MTSWTSWGVTPPTRYPFRCIFQWNRLYRNVPIARRWCRRGARRADPARPRPAATHDARLAYDLDRLRPGHHRDGGARWGAQVGERVVAARAGDGATPVESQPAGAGPGLFRAAWSGVQ
jgi:hypothetical protein